MHHACTAARVGQLARLWGPTFICSCRQNQPRSHTGVATPSLQLVGVFPSGRLPSRQHLITPIYVGICVVSAQTGKLNSPLNRAFKAITYLCNLCHYFSVMSYYSNPSHTNCIVHPEPSIGLVSNAALASIIFGVLGSGVADSVDFQRLLWPRRFYNGDSFRALLAMCLKPMGGPNHNAALETLDKFRRKGLCDGPMQGHMLGTAFYPDTGLTYNFHGYDGPDDDKEVRNGLWVTVLQYCRRVQGPQSVLAMKTDSEARSDRSNPPRRTTQVVHHLQLWRPANYGEYHNAKIFSEDQSPLALIFPIVVSEISAVICAAAVCHVGDCIWFSIYLCIPLVLKLLSVPLSVRRGPKSNKMEESSFNRVESKSQKTVLFEISNYDYGFPIIEGNEQDVRQFFKHWGHPLRENSRDRLREIGSMALVAVFVFYFPIGLLSMLWVSHRVRTLWLFYQIYVVAAMHITRLRGSNGGGRTEEGMAEALSQSQLVGLRSSNGDVILAKLDSTPVERMLHGKAKIAQIIRGHAEMMSSRV